MEKNTCKKISKATFYLGLFLLIFIFALEKIFLKEITLETNVYAKLFTMFLFYSSITLNILTREKKPFRKSLNYLKNNLNYIYAVMFFFFAFALIGFVFHESFTFIDEILKKLLEQTLTLNPSELTCFILLNNLIASITGLFGGIVLGIVPILSSITNGIIIGYVIEKAGVINVWRLLPHGIFELPAIFISFGLGIKLGFGFFNNYVGYYWKKTKILVLLPVVLALFSLVVNISSIDLLSQKIPFPLKNVFLIPLLFILNVLFYVTTLILLTCICNKKLRKIQSNCLYQNFRSSLLVLIFIVVPLLIVAALIEGALITFFP